MLLSLVLVVRGAGLTTANIALLAGAFQGLARASVPDASSVTRIMQQVGGSFGTAVLAVILVGHSFHVAFWWSVAFTGLAVLPALILPGRSRAAALRPRRLRAHGTGGTRSAAGPVLWATARRPASRIPPRPCVSGRRR